MRGHAVAPVRGRRPGWMALGLLVVVLSAAPARAQQPPAGAAPAPPANPFVFAEGGVVASVVKPDKTADFEMVLQKLKEGLAKSEKPERREQAAGWRVFKADEAGPNGAVIYVFVMDPAVKGADYSIGNLLVETYGEEGRTLYKTYSDAYASPPFAVLLHLRKFMDFGK